VSAPAKPSTRTLIEALLGLVADSPDFETFRASARDALDRLDAQWEAEQLDAWPVLDHEPDIPPELRP
jgi:hypothetical protein